LDPSSEEPLSSWLATSFSTHCTFAQLQELQLYPSSLQGGFHALTKCIADAKEVLTKLVVRDRYLVWEEVSAVVGLFAGRPAGDGLTSLRINVRTLTIELFDLLYQNLPDLQTVAIYVGDANIQSEPTALVGGISWLPNIKTNNRFSRLSAMG
jgi:hypothetical protein